METSIATPTQAAQTSGQPHGDVPAETKAPRAPRKPPIELTAKAVEMVKKAMEDQKLDGFTLRVAVVGGGCSGFNYDLDLIKETRPTDFTFVMDGLAVAIDPMSTQYLKGTVVDYVESLQGAGFKFQNPNAKSTCGCGSSFSA
jgi:iron-sulfur cluster assembly accessory protein